MAEIRGAGDIFFNKHLSISRSYSKYLKKEFIIKDNKLLGIPEKKYKPKEKTLLSSSQQTLIIKHFEKVCPNFNVYLKTLYHLAIRLKELRLLTCSMIKENNEIWYLELPNEITKNDKKGIVLIPDDLKKDFAQWDFSHPDWYIFGKGFQTNPIKHGDNRANKIWREEVKKKLGIQSDMYWLKSKSSNDKMRNGMSLDAVRIANRHSDKEITKIYATESALLRWNRILISSVNLNKVFPLFRGIFLFLKFQTIRILPIVPKRNDVNIIFYNCVKNGIITQY